MQWLSNAIGFDSCCRDIWITEHYLWYLYAFCAYLKRLLMSWSTFNVAVTPPHLAVVYDPPKAIFGSGLGWDYLMAVTASCGNYRVKLAVKGIDPICKYH